MPDRWWTVFQADRLNGLVSQALQSNFDVQTAWQRLRQARAVVDRASAALLPDLEASARGEASRKESNDDERLRLGLTSSYEVDLWGRIDSSIEAERYRARASRFDYQTAALSLSAEVVRTWFQRLEAGKQLELLTAQLNTNRKILSLLQARFKNGQIRSADVLRQKQLLESTRERKLAAEEQLRLLEHQLNVLLGRPPHKDIKPPEMDLPALPPLPQTGLPIELIRRRPDVQAAHARLQAADRDLAAAISDRYPRLTLTASLSSTDDASGELFQNWARSVAGDLLAPLFDAGQRAAEVDRSRALKQQRLYEYGQAVLTAFREVEDSLMQEKKQSLRINSLASQVRLAERTSKQLLFEYLYGLGTFIDVLTALSEEQELRRQLLSARLRRLELRIGLYRALAGGFQTVEKQPG